jgi:iron complex transport system ATP-binding protein
VIGAKALLAPTTIVFAPGTVTAILGLNGAGKTTLMRAAAGRLRPRTGTVLYDDRPLSTFGARELALRRAFLAQQAELAFALPVEEVVLMGRYPHYGRRPAAQDRAIVTEALALVGMADGRARLYPSLSGGEQQRVQIARVLAQIWADDDAAPVRTLFLDEPIAGIDVRYQLNLLALARTVAARNCSVVMTLHDLNLAADWSDRLILMHDGAVVADVAGGTPLDPDLVERVFDVRSTWLDDGRGGGTLRFHP